MKPEVVLQRVDQLGRELVVGREGPQGFGLVPKSARALVLLDHQ